jgi:hypothetical protein
MPMFPKLWSMLVVSLPSTHKTPRMRVWRALKTRGAEPLRDGVYVLPHSEAARKALDEQARDVIASGGSAQVLDFASASEGQQHELVNMFDRSEAYAEVLDSLEQLKRRVAKLDEGAARRALLSVRREFDALVAVDFFPGPSRDQVEASLADAVAALDRRFSPDEPHAASSHIRTQDPRDYCGRTWGTREHLWIDRVASAWLIRRFIDTQAKFQWLKKPKNCPKRTIGFDFDGAEFTHIGERVTFEVLMTAFGLSDDHALARVGMLVHYMDVGGVELPEAAGLAAIAAGLRAGHATDDAYLAAMTPVLDALYSTFSDSKGTRP